MSGFLRRILSKITNVSSTTSPSNAIKSSLTQVVGKDHLGNVYYEEPISKSVGMRKTKRFYEAANASDFTNPVPPEWFAWLNYRRNDPPTQEQIFANIEDSAIRKERATELAKKLTPKVDGPEQEKGHSNPFEKWPKRYQND